MKIMEIIPLWQVLSLSGIIFWIFISSFLNLTHKVRSLLQTSITHLVVNGTPFILHIQGFQHVVFDTFFSAISCVVSVPFYTAFLPLLFWSGHSKLGRQMTLLMAFCDYLGNAIKDVVSAPRPNSPPVRRITATKDEKENALEYGLPSSHTLNTVCLSGYLLYYVLANSSDTNGVVILAGIFMVCVLVGLIGFGRIYLGMHSAIDVVGGLVVGLVILRFWILIHDYVDSFIISGQNVIAFSAALSVLSLFAYPTPELPTPSFEYHAAFTGVAFGIVTGVHQTYLQFHHDNVPHIFSPQLTMTKFLGRTFVGIPTILIVKFCTKALAKWMLPVICNTLGIPISSSCYISALKESVASIEDGESILALKESVASIEEGESIPALKESVASIEDGESIPALKESVASIEDGESERLGYLQRMCFSSQESYDVDTGIRFLQYAGLAWSVVNLVPLIFSHLRL
ncbi:lipid phosphate phosphatase delta-like [Tasmannia lanceolata]|uniref:lipid phosphate phosphatase delta-like n=1 Tax=Tasmannia lanceolata TaxID=3420 RepID=UPI0040635B7A